MLSQCSQSRDNMVPRHDTQNDAKYGDHATFKGGKWTAVAAPWWDKLTLLIVQPFAACPISPHSISSRIVRNEISVHVHGVVQGMKCQQRGKNYTKVQTFTVWKQNSSATSWAPCRDACNMSQHRSVRCRNAKCQGPFSIRLKVKPRELILWMALVSRSHMDWGLPKLYIDFNTHTPKWACTQSQRFSNRFRYVHSLWTCTFHVKILNTLAWLNVKDGQKCVQFHHTICAAFWCQHYKDHLSHFSWSSASGKQRTRIPAFTYVDVRILRVNTNLAVTNNIKNSEPHNLQWSVQQ